MTTIATRPQQSLVTQRPVVEELVQRMHESLSNIAGLSHVNGDDTISAPRVGAAVIVGDARDQFALLTIDPTRLHHIPLARLRRQDVLDRLTLSVRAPIFLATPDVLMQMFADLNRRQAESAVVYIVPLNPQAGQRTELPRRVEFNLEGVPTGDLIVAFGQAADGVLHRSLPELGHIIVSGATGSGKTSLVHSLIASLVTRHTRAEVQFVFVDPKQVEFSLWANLPHLARPVAYELDEAEAAMSWVRQEADRRLKLFTAVGVQNLPAYNQQSDVPLPWLVIVIDELLDLIRAVKKTSAFYTMLMRNLGLARAAGMTFVLSTTDARAETLDASIKYNTKTRVSGYAEKGSSLAVLDSPAASGLPRNLPGRMLVRLPDQRTLIQFQAFYLAASLIKQIVQSASGGVRVLDALERSATLTDLQLEMIAFAQEHGGEMVFADLWREFAGRGLSANSLKEMLKTCEIKGWLARDGAVTSPRKMTPALWQVAGLALTESVK